MKSFTWRGLATAGILAAVLSITACGGSQSAPATVPGSETPAASASPTESAKPAPVAKDGTPLTGTHGLKVKGPAENEHGQYLQITVSDNDPALVYNPALVMPEVSAKYTAEEIADAHKFSMTFFVEEGLDSTINSGNNVDEWLNREIENFSPRLHTEMVNAVEANKEFINRRAWGAGEQYNYYYDKDSTRILGYIITPTQVGPSANPANPETMVFSYNYEVNYVLTNLAGDIFPVNLKGTGHVGVEKDPTTPGKWLITQMETNYDAFIPTENKNP